MDRFATSFEEDSEHDENSFDCTKCCRMYKMSIETIIYPVVTESTASHHSDIFGPNGGRAREETGNMFEIYTPSEAVGPGK